MALLGILEKYWPLLVFVIGIIWKLIAQHFTVKGLTINDAKRELKIEALQKEFNSALKEHVGEHRISIDKLTDAVTELIKITSIIATKIEAREHYDNINEKRHI